MKLSTTLFFLFIISASFAQTWSNDVASIVYDKCTKCHHQGGIGGFSLMTHAEITPMATAVSHAINDGHMPPWPPNNNYQTYIHNRALSATEKTTLSSWILNGMPLGNANAIPPAPVYSSAAIFGAGDLTVQIPTYTSKATSTKDDYACFAVPSGLLQNRVIKAVEIIPGNREIVHHALIYLDPNGVESTDSIGGNCASPSNANTKLIAGYTPGATPMLLPSIAPLKLGINISAGSQIYFAMHYPAGSFGQKDSTKVIFHFYPVGTTGIRQVMASPIIENWAFSLPPNQETTVNAQYPASGGLTNNVSILSVFPHMHLLGKTIKSFGIKPNGDTLKLIDIPHWDFHWQDFYFFQSIQKAPIGTTIYGTGIYDNTSNNMHNPNNPPINVTAGLNTSDEMFLVYFHYMLYQNGDENYNIEDYMNLSAEELLSNTDASVLVYPNPFEKEVSIDVKSLKAGDILSAYIYDSQGKLIKKLSNNYELQQDGYTINWDGNTEENVLVKKGVYYISLRINGVESSKQLVKF